MRTTKQTAQAIQNTVLEIRENLRIGNKNRINEDRIRTVCDNNQVNESHILTVMDRAFRN